MLSMSYYESLRDNYKGHTVGAKFRKLIGIHFRRRLGHKVTPFLRLWKRHHITNRTNAAKECRQAIDTESESAMRRRSILESFHEETKFLFRLLIGETQDLEHR